MQTRSDERLVALVLDGHDAAFEVLFDRHVADSLWYARDVLGSWGEAEEAVHHSFAAAHAYLETRGREAEFRPWLQTILGNYCLSMLHARTSSRQAPADDATVVDLGEWRLRRKLLGVALPIAPSAGLRDSVLAACGIGAGATTAGSPLLLSGVVAKLAVVAVLAGGAGVVGDVASDRAVPIDTGRQAPIERAVDAASESRADADPARKSTGGADGAPRLMVPDLDSAPRPVQERVARKQAPEEPSLLEPASVESSPSTGSGSASPRLPTPDSTIEDVTAVIPPPVQSTLRRVVDVVKARVPVADDLSEARPPAAVELSKIRDDLGVTAVRSPVDVRSLLSRGTAVLSK